MWKVNTPFALHDIWAHVALLSVTKCFVCHLGTIKQKQWSCCGMKQQCSFHLFEFSKHVWLPSLGSSVLRGQREAVGFVVDFFELVSNPLLPSVDAIRVTQFFSIFLQNSSGDSTSEYTSPKSNKFRCLDNTHFSNKIILNYFLFLYLCLCAIAHQFNATVRDNLTPTTTAVTTESTPNFTTSKGPNTIVTTSKSVFFLLCVVQS